MQSASFESATQNTSNCKFLDSVIINDVIKMQNKQRTEPGSDPKDGISTAPRYLTKRKRVRRVDNESFKEVCRSQHKIRVLVAEVGRDGVEEEPGAKEQL